VSGAANFVNNSQYNTQVTDLNPGSNTLRWTIENSGCTSTDDVVIYNDLPYEADAGVDFEICGSTSPLYANDPVIGIGEWTVISGNATFDDASRFDVTVSDLGFGANTLRWTITYASCITSDELVVINNEIDVYAGVDQTVTESTTWLAASNPATGSGQWAVIGGAGNFNEPNNSVTEVSGLGSGLNTFRWSVTINGCISFDDVSITYDVLPVSSLVITTSEGCPPLDVYFINNSLDGLPFTWDFDDGTTSDQVTIKHTFTEPGIYKPSLTIIGNNGEVIVKDTIVTVYDQPNASFLIVNKQVYIPEEEALFINTSTDAITYEWEFGDGGTSTESNPRYVYETEGIYNIILHAWSENDCYDSTIVVGGVEVYESGAVVFPTAFTPNLDGSSGGVYNENDFSNDVFYPIGEGITNYHLEVFNRWGILVFESSDISIGWDGYYDGELLNEGVYVWKVTGKINNGKDFNEVGTIMLLR
jgi:gliding motility-associated-like protein